LDSSDYYLNYAAFRSKLREARLSAGLTQQQASELLTKPQSFVAKCESGERRVDIIELLDFARIYHKKLDYFSNYNSLDSNTT